MNSENYTHSFMKFEIVNLAEEFKNTIHWMLENDNEDVIKKFLMTLIQNKKELIQNPNNFEALKDIVDLIVTQSRYYNQRKNFEDEMTTFFSRFGTNYKEPNAQYELIRIVEKIAPPRINDNAKIKIQNLLIYLNDLTIQQFSELLYSSTKGGQNNIKVLGEKGRDNYLRDFGYWDRIPMDRHEIRFILRSGIYHACSENNNNDPLEKSSLHNALANLCSNYFKAFSINGIDLGNAPGIVDVFIWWFSAKEENYNICGSVPNCIKCPLNNVCLYSIINK